MPPEFYVISLDAGMPPGVYLPHHEARNSDPDEKRRGLIYLEVHKFCSILPAFTFEARPVVPVADAIRVELEAMAYRDGLKSK
jgi:hypothetical protein